MTLKTTHWIWCRDPDAAELPEIELKEQDLFWIALKYTPHLNRYDDKDTDLYYALSLEDYRQIA